MSTAHRRYLRQEAAKASSTQAKFSRDGSVLTTAAGIFAEQTSVDVTQLVRCPFCLSQAKLQSFLISTKEGISSSKGQCSGCGRGMMLRNLVTMKWTPEKYAEWVFGYSLNGFWQKIQFSTWKERLAEIGWARQFWDKYKALKAEATSSDDTENFTEYINRKGQEAAQEWNQEIPGE